MLYRFPDMHRHTKIIATMGPAVAGAGAVRELIDAGMDTLVLGCTHYPFLTSDIRSIVGDRVTIIDPAPAVARQVARVVDDVGRAEQSGGKVRYATTADPDRLAQMIAALLGAAPDEPPTRW